MEQEYCMRDDHTNVAIPFRSLYGDVCPLTKDILSQATYDFQNHCGMKCLQNPLCAGYNFKKKHQKKTPNCQLTNTLDHNFHECNADDKGWIFYHPVAPRMVPCHKMKNCKNGGKTIIYLKDGPGSDPYRCECLKGFSGDLCQIVPTLSDSVILSGEPADFLTRLTSWTGKPSSNWTLCWRATLHGWAASTFHLKCDNKKPTVTIIKVGNFIFGGYATESWN
ncbi:fibropellin-1-like isoform X1, partial [Paramuricea clavata]